ncbi:protein AMN1 homolog [Sycon ciliatum]|uniref:protein AMN1 homolog n=1 Tax=Sycon ciliatum TaxID=27933 RepID=UPI0031F71382
MSQVTSLKSRALSSVVKQLDRYLQAVPELPFTVRADLLRLACKRGLIRDDNLPQLLTDGSMTLDFSHSDAVGDAALVLVAAKCPYLTSLNLNWTVRAQDLSTDGVTDEGIHALAKSCPNLQWLLCRNRGNITSSSVIAITKRCQLLRTLDLGGCIIDDSLLTAVAENCHSLKSINLSFTSVTSKGFASLCHTESACFRTLEEIHATNCAQICDDAIQCAARLPSLSILIFHNCRLVTEASRLHLDDILQRQQGRARRERRPGAKPRPVQMSWTVY